LHEKAGFVKASPHDDGLQRYDNARKRHDKNAVSWCHGNVLFSHHRKAGKTAGKCMTMSRFFNITTSDDGTSTIFLYGDIGDYTEVQSGRIAQELMEAERVSRRIHVRINSNGGEVYSGIAIFNALRHSQADIRIYVDGIAASMASVIALCGKPVEMSKYARLMLHSVSGGCYGNKQDLQRCMEEIESLEGSLSEIYAERLGMSQEEVRQTYFDGEDHWLTAQEALDLGFINGIYDADPVPADSTPAQIYTLFNNRLIEPQKNREDMNLEDVKKRPRFKDCASDADVFRLMDQLEEEAGKVPILTKENTDLKAKVKTYEDKAAAEDLADRKQLLDAAEQDGRIDATTRPIYENLLANDRENGEKALAQLPVKRRVMEDLHLDPNGEESPWAKRIREIKDKRKK
jgi:ATP-dependent Clp endopeptidase proteolytic subunit ClpP